MSRGGMERGDEPGRAQGSGLIDSPVQADGTHRTAGVASAISTNSSRSPYNNAGDIGGQGVRCGRCRMLFRVEGPSGSGEAGATGPATRAGAMEFLRCPDCGRRFWADPYAGGPDRCAVGILPSPSPSAPGGSPRPAPGIREARP